MSAERHEAAAYPGTHSKNIADLIDLNVGEPQFAKTVGEPSPARSFPKWRRGHARRLHLPERKLGFFRAEAVERGPHGRGASQARDFLLHRGIRIGNFHEWNRLHPLRLSYNVR